MHLMWVCLSCYTCNSQTHSKHRMYGKYAFNYKKLKRTKIKNNNIIDICVEYFLSWWKFIAKFVKKSKEKKNKKLMRFSFHPFTHTNICICLYIFKSLHKWVIITWITSTRTSAWIIKYIRMFSSEISNWWEQVLTTRISWREVH